jgi:hypothetical protein
MQDKYESCFLSGCGAALVFAVISAIFGDGWWNYAAGGAGFICGFWLRWTDESNKASSKEIVEAIESPTHRYVIQVCRVDAWTNTAWGSNDLAVAEGTLDKMIDNKQKIKKARVVDSIDLVVLKEMEYKGD